jgi:hypothetical protein
LSRKYWKLNGISDDREGFYLRFQALVTSELLIVATTDSETTSDNAAKRC